MDFILTLTAAFLLTKLAWTVISLGTLGVVALIFWAFDR